MKYCITSKKRLKGPARWPETVGVDATLPSSGRSATLQRAKKKLILLFCLAVSIVVEKMT